MKKQKGLGRGLDAIFGTETISLKSTPMSQMIEIDIRKIIPNPPQPRTEFNEEALDELADSIRQLGIIQPITVRNDASKKVKVKIYMRSLGAHEDSEAFLSQLKLKVKKSADNDMAYMFDAAASEAATLTDWVYLGLLYSGGEVNLDVTLDVPVTLGNEFQDAIGYLDWEFKIEEYVKEPDDPIAPPTGDSTSIGTYTAIAVCSLALIIILIAWRKKDKENDPSAASC